MLRHQVSEILLRRLACLPWGWLLALVFNLAMLVIYLHLQPAPAFLELLLLLQLMLLVGVTLRFLRTLATAESQQQVLLMQVAAGLRQLQLAEQQRTEADKKRRILQEVHDEVGYKLLSIAHAGRDTRLGGLASSALESLRDGVSRANSDETALETFLQRLREEMLLRLAGLGVALEWSVPALEAQWVVGQGQHYHLNRIFRELMHNIIRHANATQVAFAVLHDEAGWQFSLADNGVGFELARPAGAGMHAITRWAEELDARIGWHTQPGAGTRFTLLLPLDVLAAAGPPAKSIS